MVIHVDQKLCDICGKKLVWVVSTIGTTNTISFIKIWEVTQNSLLIWHGMTHKPARFILSYVLSITQQYKQRTAWKATLQSIQPLQKIQRICSRPKNYLLEHPYASMLRTQLRMFCSFHNNISKEQHLCNPSSHYGKYSEYARKTCAPYLNMWKPLRLNFSNVKLVS